MHDEIAFGQWLKQRRQALDLTQAALARQVGCAASTIKKLERGVLRPSKRLAKQLADQLRLSSDQHTRFLQAARLPLSAPVGATQPASSSTSQPLRANLPVPPTPLIGREQEVAAVVTLVRRPGARLLTLSGAGGIGKTRLALQAAAELLDDFADGVYFVSLASISDPVLVPAAIAQALDIREAGSQPLQELLASYLRDKHMLLVLDNIEQVLEAGSAIAELLDRASQLNVLITSRVLTRLYGEHEYVAPPLKLPDLKRLPSLPDLIQYEAVQLFIERAQAAKADFAITTENALAVAEICVQLDGLPLAIELAAVRIKLLSPALLLARLTNRLALLTGGPRNLPVRQQTLRRTIDWSYELLDPREQALFTRLAVFVGGCTLEAASAICNAAGDLPMDIFDGLASLLDKSLLRQEAGDEIRFTMLETIREYAREQLEVRGEVAVQQQHAEYYLALAEAATPELRSVHQVAWLARLDAEHDNLRAALAWLLEQQAVEPSLRLAGALWRFWHIRGHLSEGRRWLEAALALADREEHVPPSGMAPSLPDAERRAAQAQAFNGAGVLATSQGDYATARALHERSLALRRELGDTHGIAASLNNLGLMAREQGDYGAACALHEESLALRRELGHTHGIAASLNNLGLVAREQGDYRAARALFEESLTLKRELGDKLAIANSLSNLGLVAFDQGEYGMARALHEESLTLACELGDKWGVAVSLSNLGEVARAQGDYATARVLFEESLTLKRELDDKLGIAHSLEEFAGVASAQGYAEQALRLAAAATILRQAISAPLSSVEQARLDRWLALARQALSEATHSAAEQAGSAMTLEQAIAYALEPVPQPPSPTPAQAPYPAGLTAREVEVLRLVAQGLTNVQIAERLVISPRTVNAHLSAIYGKLGASSRSAATRFAVEHHLV